METVFLLIYGLYIGGKKSFIQNQHEHMIKNYTLKYTNKSLIINIVANHYTSF